MVLLEAMAAGCPIVATDVGGVSTVIKSGKTGLLVKPGNPDEIAQCVRMLLGDNLSRQNIIKEARNEFVNGFEASVMTRKYETLYLQEFQGS
jgi:glycosyltransferase involved in cell wall biosynthesis